MSDALLPYYNRELNALRTLALEFARAHPKIAGRLRLADGVTDDPHLGRLLEGTAFLAARVHARLDDEFPELTDALLSLLYPHYLAPVPSCCIARFACQPSAKGKVEIPRGRLLDTERVRGETCRFATAAALTLWPVVVEHVRLSGLPLAAPVNAQASRAASVLRIALITADPALRFDQLGIDTLQFYVAGPANVALPLCELLGAHVLSVAYADSAADATPVIVPAACVTQTGFSPDEALLPFPARAFGGYRLLSEYFALPEKFRFFRFAGLEAKTLADAGNRLEVFVYLDRAAPELERSVSAETLQLGCAPLVNLFPQRCEPVPLDPTSTEYLIEPDVRRPGGLEIWSVERVRESSADGTQRAWQPFYRLEHDGGSNEPFYTLARRSASGRGGTDMFLQPFDPAATAEAPQGAVLSVDALCLNRDLPSDLPFGAGRPHLALTEPMAAVRSLECLTAPTATLRALTRSKGFWPLIGHLSLGHLSVSGGEEAARTLRAVLGLYDLRDSEESRSAIAALLSVESAAGVARVPGARAGAFCRGLDVRLEWESRGWSSGGLYVLASVLERFLALHASVNSFVRTHCVLRGRPDTVARWPARAGAQVLL